MEYPMIKKVKAINQFTHIHRYKHKAISDVIFYILALPHTQIEMSIFFQLSVVSKEMFSIQTALAVNTA